MNWEYKSIEISWIIFMESKITKILNKEGAEGWELVSAVKNDNKSTLSILCILKRPIE